MPQLRVLNELQIKQNGITTTYKLGTVNGYYKSSDGKFYAEPAYITEIEGAPNLVYADIGGNNLYIYKTSTSSFVKVSGTGGGDNIKFGYFNETDGKFYEDDQYTVEIPGNADYLFITLDTNFIYRYNTADTEFVQIGGGDGISDAIVYVNELPSSDIKNVIYCISNESSSSETVADGFLDSNELFIKTEGVSGDYTYTAEDGITIEASTDGSTFLGFESLNFDGASDWILTFKDSSTEILADGDTFYYKQINTLFFAGNETTQSLIPLGSGGGGGEAVTYFAGEGISIDANNIISIDPATTSTLGGIKPDNSTTIVTANGTLKGNYQGGYGIKIDNNEILAKTFVGTQAEWNLLTTAEKAEFDTVSITDDGTAQNTNPGHEIIDGAGTALPQRNSLQFEDVTVADDSVNDITKVTPIPYTAGRGIEIDNKEVACGDEIVTTFVGTKTEWDALSAADKSKYEIVNLTDDVANGGAVVVDTVAEGNMNAVTSNAVYLALQNKQQGYIIPASESVTVDAGSTTTVPLTIIGDGAISVTSSDSTKATGSVSNGVLTITGVGGGIATITITMADSSTYLGTSATVSVTSVPNGSTVTPTDDIQTWLACGGIFDKSYTSISEVLADSSTLGTLISSTNAVDYMVRSTSWATTVCANSTAMSLIGLNNYCANTLLADSTWLNAIANSTYIESVMNVKVPTMTSNTTPSGVASTNATGSGGTFAQRAYYAFNGQDCSLTNDVTTAYMNYIGYEFSSSKRVLCVKWSTIYTVNVGGNYILKGSVDGSSFTDLVSGTFPSTANSVQINSFTNSTSYKYYRLYVDNTIVGGDNYRYTYVKDVQFYGREDV